MPFQSDIPMGAPLLGELTGKIDVLASAQFGATGGEDALHIEFHLPWQGEARVEVEGGEVVAIALAEIEVGTCREGEDACAIEHGGIQSAAILLVLYHLIVGGEREIEIALAIVVAQLVSSMYRATKPCLMSSQSSYDRSWSMTKDGLMNLR